MSFELVLTARSVQAVCFVQTNLIQKCKSQLIFQHTSWKSCLPNPPVVLFLYKQRGETWEGKAIGPFFSKVRCQDGVKFSAAEKLRPISDPLQCGYGKHLNWFHTGGLCVCLCACTFSRSRYVWRYHSNTTVCSTKYKHSTKGHS